MGTRSITVVCDSDSQEYLRFYRQFDGYIYRQFDGYINCGHGEALFKFLDGMSMLNGIPGGLNPNGKYANGTGCLAAQMIAHFKNANPLGGIYMVSQAAGTADDDLFKTYWEDYNYRITCPSIRNIQAGHTTIIIQIFDYNGKEIFKGDVSEFGRLIEKLKNGECDIE